MPLLQFLVSLFTSHGYFAVFAVLLICGFGVPIPEDITLVAGGIIAGLGYADVHVMCVVGIVGALIGDSVMFLTGYHLGFRAIKLRWISWLLTPRRYARVQEKFSRYGNRLMFIARFLPGLRSPIFLTAGMTRRVSFARFILLDGAAALISVPIWVYLGFFGAENHAWLLLWIKRFKTALLIVVVLLAIAAAAWAWRYWLRRRDVLQRLRRRRLAIRS
ncbi:MAG: DedA family protein [Dokdonella sp.]